jgi:RNA polymerase sigma-70 factor (ECF subfamily)
MSKVAIHFAIGKFEIWCMGETQVAFLDTEPLSKTKKPASNIFRVIQGGKLDSKSNVRATDLTLAGKIAGGDQLAMKQVYELHSGPLFHFVKTWLADPHEASDIVHETMLEVWRRADRFQGRSSLKSWIFSIARNKSIDKNRKLSRLSYTDEAPELVDDELGPLEAVELSQDAAILKASIERLSDTHRRMIHLAFYEDLSYREISEVENCPIGTVKTRILHAKKLLMRDLADQVRQ